MTQQNDVLSVIQNAAATGARELDLRDRGLDSLPSEIGQISTLEVLWLDRNNLRSLPNSLQHLKRLHLLSLRNNELSTLPSWLNRLPELRQIFIDYNLFGQVPDEIWQLNDVISLGLSGIKKPDLSKIRRYPNLRTLYLQECGLHGLPNDLYSLERIATLYLEGNELSSLPYFLVAMQELETIYLSRNAFKSVPESLMRMNHLRYINLAQNEIERLSHRISNWTELRTLVVANNPLGQLPEQIGTLKNLTSLYAYSADLLELPTSLTFASNLEILEVGNNLLTSLPLQISRLKKLETLNLFNNGLVEIPLSVCGLTKLKELKVDSNDLRSLFPEVGQLSQLEVLDVRNNQLSELPSQIGNLSKLRVLRVANNTLDELPESIGNLNQLTDLDISYNRGLHRFPETMTNLGRLRTFTFSNIGINVPHDMWGNTSRVLQFLSHQSGRVGRDPSDEITVESGFDTADRSSSYRSRRDDFEINFLPDVDELKRQERRQNQEPNVLRISRLEMDGIVDVFPYQKLQVVYMFEHTLLPVPPWFVAHMFLARSRRFRTKKSWVGGGVLSYEDANPDTAQHVARLDSSLEHNALALTVIGPFPQNFFSLLLSGLDRVVNGSVLETSK